MMGTESATALQHLGRSAVFWISLARATERHTQWHERTDHLFRRSTRVEAVDARELSDEDVMRHLKETARVFTTDRNVVRFKYPPPNLTSAISRATARVNAAVRLSHLKALEAGIDSGEERFFVAEDDLVPRSAMLEEEVPLPPMHTQLAIWSGGLPRFNISRDERLYCEGRALKWRPVHGDSAYRCFGAELYEVERETALFMVEIASGYDIPWDHAWGFVIRDLFTYRLEPRAFAQIGKSYRNRKTRHQTIERGTT